MILTLDLGLTVGWAAGGGPVPARWGSLRLGTLPDDSAIGPCLARFLDQLAPLVKELRPSEVFIEAPLPPEAVNNRAAQRNGAPGQVYGRGIYVTMQYMLAGATRLLCFRMGVPVQNARVNTVRAYFLRGIQHEDATGRKIEPKDRVILAAVRRGWRVANDHEADACAILAWRLAQQQELRL